MLVHVLDAIVELGRASGWASQDSPEAASVRVRKRVEDAEFWLQSRMLTQIERVPLTPRAVSRVRAGRANQRYLSVIEAHGDYSLRIRDFANMPLEKWATLGRGVAEIPVAIACRPLVRPTYAGTRFQKILVSSDGVDDCIRLAATEAFGFASIGGHTDVAIWFDPTIAH
jgi:hypothetical protein